MDSLDKKNHQAWRTILDRNRTDSFRQRRYDLCLLWRACAFQSATEAPEPLARAQAFKCVLDHLAIEADEGIIRHSHRDNPCIG